MPKIKVVDIFAGPGGLGEGFARYSSTGEIRDRPFEIVLSAEKDPAAVRTLCLRTFFRLCEQSGHVPSSYYEYARGERDVPWDAATADLWHRAEAETQPLELGSRDGDRRLDRMLSEQTPKSGKWVLIGGPPCQAYSLAGRSRNKGVKGYRPEHDERHFLYQHYLRVLAEYQPAAFVMENVKGILSSHVAGERIFPQITADLARPDRALGRPDGLHYHLRPLVIPGAIDDSTDPQPFVVRAENHGVPQARHRVIILGIRNDQIRGDSGLCPSSMKAVNPVNLDSLVAGMPPLRSGARGVDDNAGAWRAAIEREITARVAAGLPRRVAREMRRQLRLPDAKWPREGRGGRFVRVNRARKGRSITEKELHAWLTTPRLDGVLNHETRSHMTSDLVRYLFAACHARETGRTPTAADFPQALAPAHRNWDTGAFADRFRVQTYGRPATTITSHISKDGHYYIHPDPRQCRSFTVREAARLQTFPEDFFFEGGRTDQYMQVGNAVPPFLARQIAAELERLLR